MARNFTVKYTKRWALGWGVFLILIAALVLANQFGGFVELGFWSLAVAAFAVVFFIQCLVELNFGAVPIPLAALYYILHKPFELPEIGFWPLALVAFLTSAGLYVLLPKRRRKKKDDVEIVFTNSRKRNRDNIDGSKEQIIEEGDENNPYISVQFGSVSRYIHSDNLESLELDSKCGSLEVYLDHAELSPNGAVAQISCKLGNIELYIPEHWRVIDNLTCSLGNADVDGRLLKDDENAPTLTLNGDVALGNIEVHKIRSARDD